MTSLLKLGILPCMPHIPCSLNINNTIIKHGLSNTFKPEYNGPVSSSHPLLSSQFSKSQVFAYTCKCTNAILANYLLSSNGHTIAVQCLFFFVVFTCIKWPPFNGKKLRQIMRYFIVFKMIPRHCKEITCTKLLHADNLLLNIVNTFQMSTMCYQSNSTISLDHAQCSCIKWPVPQVLRAAPVYTCVYLNVR